MNQLSEKRGVQVRFLLGPAGAGKTFRCLEEIRVELKRAPEGPPLVFLAPKQATFQIERQLLSDPQLAGYTRLRILSFERCAEFVLEKLHGGAPRLLSEEGRVMVLRALLARKAEELRVFHSTARLPGFAREMSALLRDFQRGAADTKKIAHTVERVGAETPLGRKLADAALLLRSYLEWLRGQRLDDANGLLEIASEAVRDAGESRPRIAGLWLDGFAEMTPQEIAFLRVLIPCCESATLAFCLEEEPREENASWLSLWSAVAQTFRACRNALELDGKAEVGVEILKREESRSRFAGNHVLAHVEKHWAQPVPLRTQPPRSGALSENLETVRLVACADPEKEAVLAAREIRRFVRKDGARYRDCAVLLRDLDGYADLLERVFERYGIPFFLDRRETVAHHPLAELTRSGLRTIAFRWQSEDWFAALKTGLLPEDQTEVDLLENVALAHGWEGDDWLRPLAFRDDPASGERMESLRGRILPPFLALRQALRPAGVTNAKAKGVELAAAVRAFWGAIGIEQRLGEWARARSSDGTRAPALHGTVLEQMEEWLANVELAFRDESLELRDWLPILDAGLASLTVGVIPPSLDQVLIGAIDRSRNPDLKLAFLLGVNEGVFPAPPERPSILTETERDRLESENLILGRSQRQRIAHERYYGYIACTRARDRLVVTWSRANVQGDPMNPSAFVRRLRELLPDIRVEEPSPDITFDLAEHACEVIAPRLRAEAATPDGAATPFDSLPEVKSVLAKWRTLSQFTTPDSLHLSRDVAARLYPEQLQTSVSALERFAACPFKFFVSRGLRADERKQFEMDDRQRGLFQHEILRRFQECLAANGRRWREVSREEAARLVAEIGEAQLDAFENRLFRRTASAEFTARTMIRNLQKLVMTLVGWAARSEFEPAAAELPFGFREDGWRIAIDGGRELILSGRIDRIDLCRRADGRVLATVIDYKSSARKLDDVKLEAGLDLQLLSYLGVLRRVTGIARKLSAEAITPAGAFYVGLAPKRSAGRTRQDARPTNPFQHVGRFQREHLSLFDNRGELRGEQFRFAKKQDGDFAKNGNDSLPESDFNALMDLVETHLRRIGRDLLGGNIAIDPFSHRGQTACEYCDYAAICRFDSWTQRYRRLGPTTDNTTKGGA